MSTQLSKIINALSDNNKMEIYKNTSGKSGVSAYETGTTWIKVKLTSGGDIYTYSYHKAGRHHIEQMKILAQKGSGLTTYINKNVKDLYD